MLTHRSSWGLSFKKNVRTCSTDSLTASSANKMSAYSVNSVNTNFMSLPPLRPMPIVESGVEQDREQSSARDVAFYHLHERGSIRRTPSRK